MNCEKAAADFGKYAFHRIALVMFADYVLTFAT